MVVAAQVGNHGRSMSLFTRKPDEREPKRCAGCGERLPEGARECTMCGRRVEPADAPPNKVQGS
jgi:hypothetical protein